MRAISYSTPGDWHKTFQFTENYPIPIANKTGTVLVRVKYCAIDPGEYHAAGGKLPINLKNFPAVPGLDIAGVIEDVHPSCSRFMQGDEVFGVLPVETGGGCCEFVVVQEDSLMKKPASLSFKEAATLATAALTSEQALASANLKPGDRVFIYGGATCTGMWAIQSAKRQGCYVGTTARPSKSQVAKDCGADEVFDYTQKDWHKAISSKYDVFYQTTAFTFDLAKTILKPSNQSRYVTISGQNGKDPQTLKLLAFMLKLVSSKLWSFLPWYPSFTFILLSPTRTLFDVVEAHVADPEAGETKPKTIALVDSVFQLEDTAKAFDKSYNGPHGRVLIDVPGNQ